MQCSAERLRATMKQVPAYIRGYDVRTGKLLWTFHTVPQGTEFGVDTWKEDSWKYTGNTARVGADERRSGTRLRLSARSKHRPATTTAAIARATTCSGTASFVSTQRPANASGTTS